jgi:metal-responsive CopG/Arc/MetJ family transcriptional regulator
MASTKTQLTITIKSELVTKIDEMVDKIGGSRSSWASKAIEYFLENNKIITPWLEDNHDQSEGESS